MDNFRNTSFGIIALGVVSSLIASSIAAFIWRKREALDYFKNTVRGPLLFGVTCALVGTFAWEHWLKHYGEPEAKQSHPTQVTPPLTKPEPPVVVRYSGRADTSTNAAPRDKAEQIPVPPAEAETPSPVHEDQELELRKIAYADFSGPLIRSQGMVVTPLPGFSFNTSFPQMFGGTWRVTTIGSGLAAIFRVPADGRYSLVITDGSSYDDMRRRAGYSPVTIRVNSQVVASRHSPVGPQGKMAMDQWQIFAHAGQNTLEVRVDDGATTHYWIQSIEIVQ
jgi:hypothetical protein